MSRLIKKVLPVLFLLALFQSPVFAHDVALPVIIDTDMALDDIRAITMLLNSEVVQVPEAGKSKVWMQIIVPPLKSLPQK